MSERKTIPTITPQDVLALLEQGYTRFKKDDTGLGSIQEKYGLSDTHIKRLFQHPLLKNKKTKDPGFILVESTPVTAPTITITNVVEYDPKNITADSIEELFK